MFSLIYAWINDWVNNREAGDLRRQHGHYDVIVMWYRVQHVLHFPLQSEPGQRIRLWFDGQFDVFCRKGVAYHWVEIRYLQGNGQDGKQVLTGPRLVQSYSIILGMGLANERKLYYAKLPLIGRLIPKMIPGVVNLTCRRSDDHGPTLTKRCANVSPTYFAVWVHICVTRAQWVNSSSHYYVFRCSTTKRR